MGPNVSLSDLKRAIEVLEGCELTLKATEEVPDEDGTTRRSRISTRADESSKFHEVRVSITMPFDLKSPLTTRYIARAIQSLETQIFDTVRHMAMTDREEAIRVIRALGFPSEDT